jgi:hypothetical protein
LSEVVTFCNSPWIVGRCVVVVWSLCGRCVVVVWS